MKALVIGATGATGRDLTEILLNDPSYSAVSVFVRRTTGIAHPKLKEVITNFDQLDTVKSEISGDVLFSCLGTTLKDAGSKEKQHHIDLEIPSKFAELSRNAGVTAAVLLSAYGASPTSKIFYSRLKGSLEQRMIAMQFDQLVIFRPGLLLRKNTNRFTEKFAGAALKMINSIGLLKKYKPLPTETLAAKMAAAPLQLQRGTHIIALNKIFDF